MGAGALSALPISVLIAHFVWFSRQSGMWATLLNQGYNPRFHPPRILSCIPGNPHPWLKGFLISGL